eukprot:CAMPEP_0185040802 /NCGR_PEP_ID=MMETSP1103-20130426/39299_1 /TAXON_ID=36769 /ORGANISM="Paraphysomonas bandaiensis, Strain Caron Lab Isolate" /LENGTH=725 /DNA_ID=CAMNT_0027580249 /DNA_START=29 /DNA_END=2206 /DNA_ORIENTATION=-
MNSLSPLLILSLLCSCISVDVSVEGVESGDMNSSDILSLIDIDTIVVSPFAPDHLSLSEVDYDIRFKLINGSTHACSRPLRLSLPGDIRDQIFRFCRTAGLSVPQCVQIEQYYFNAFKSRNVVSSVSMSETKCESGGVPGISKGCRRSGVKIVIVQLATQRAHPSATHAQQINLMYARRHGYDFVSHSCPPSVDEVHMWDPYDQVRANWAKPRIILEYLKKYHYVVMLDSDAYFREHNMPLEAFIDTHMYQSLGHTGEGYAIVLPNNCISRKENSSSVHDMFCWTEGLNIASIIAQSNHNAEYILREWSAAAYSTCRRFAHPHYAFPEWRANDQSCLSALYDSNQHIARHINVLNMEDTHRYIGGHRNAMIKHHFSGTFLAEEVGKKIKRDLFDILQEESNTVTVGNKGGRKWVKHPDSPVLGGNLGTCFDVSVLRGKVHTNWLQNSTLRARAKYVMYFSWRPFGSIAASLSDDGIKWGPPAIVMYGHQHLGREWESIVNRPFVLHMPSSSGDVEDGKYHMWYSGQPVNESTSSIGYATSSDGVSWQRNTDPVLIAQGWEGDHIMCSHVIYDRQQSLYRMWYSAGQGYEPIAIGHAVSCDGLTWNRTHDVPIFLPNPSIEWEQDRVTCPSVEYNGEYYYMFYIGFTNISKSAIGVARSFDGVTDWERHPNNPIIYPDENPDGWDYAAVYKPFPLYDGEKWMVWYNGRREEHEQVGLATLDGYNLW